MTGSTPEAAPPPTLAEPVTGSPTILVVIVNYRCAALTIDCLASLEPETSSDPGIHVVVTDNASGDDSVDRIAAAIHDRDWSRWVELQPLDRNGGFAYGNNAAIAPALQSEHPPDFVWLLNPDTVVRPGALSELVRFLQARPDVGLAGSRLENPDESTQISAFVFPSILSEIDHGLRFGPLRRLFNKVFGQPIHGRSPQPVEWVAGASLLVRREVFTQVGLLDDGFFMYYEEVDFCRRANRGGWPCWYVPSSRVVHLVGQSSGVTDRTRTAKRVPGYWFEARRRYFLRNHGRVQTLLADLGWTAATLAYLGRRGLSRQPSELPESFLRDFVRHNFLPARPR